MSDSSEVNGTAAFSSRVGPVSRRIRVIDLCAGLERDDSAVGGSIDKGWVVGDIE